MLSETRGIGTTYRAEGIDLPHSWRCYADFGGNSSAMHPAKPVASRSGFVVGIAIKQVSLIIFVSDQISPNGSVDDSSRADLLAAVLRLLPKGDVVRILNVGNGDLRHRFAKFRDQAGPDRCLFLDLRSSTDSAIEQLARALLKMDEMDGAVGDLYADAVGLAIAARLLGHGDRCDRFQPKRSCGALPKWRLKRVIDYIDANLGEPITLADLAAATVLSPMHFAAQFRMSTGIRPHEYLLRRRIERAQQLLLEPGLSIVDVALSVGFQTQSHFTTVFKRFVGDTPHQWRRSNYGELHHSQEQDRRGSEPRAISSPVDLRSARRDHREMRAPAFLASRQ
jgi:AraC-like DNA-binding protein